MREHKYRVWDKVTSSLCVSIRDAEQIKEDKKYIFYSGIFNSAPFTETSGWIQYEGSRQRYHDLIVEESTGLKDKNGKEIYEGDRVSGYYSICDNEGTFKSNIVFDEGGFCFEKVDGDWSPNMNEGYCSDIEVIGNINENPELLTGKSNE